MRVAILVLDRVFDSGLAAILDVLRTADELRGRLPLPPPAWQVTTVGFTETVRTGAGLCVHTSPIAHAESCDLLVVPTVPEQRPGELAAFLSGPESAPARELITRTRARRTPIATACAGTFLLAETGILDGLSATTTWWLAPLFRRRYPHVTLDQSRMVTESDGITTAGAAFAHTDLALNLVRHRSPALADLVASYLVLDERPSQAAHTISGTLAAADPIVAAFERWARERLHEPLSIRAPAEALGVSERTLQRTTRASLGTSPVRFVQDLRVEQATHLLRSTDLTIAAIARRVGYENANTLRILVRDRTGTTAGQHRRTPPQQLAPSPPGPSSRTRG
ncbi:GlxA family transcriptional regulator [Streptomyces sp. NBC_01022]|uniref:GlxA family transcriptional regulator n=1 Tax=Streptomyces sp. NBC_01022 TaxID=2903723 RepID=UPI002DDAE811|nr:helix-turn-helix domain-containing protein [Streptomyces sp. NBC_01022]WRZ82833.1 helix-turn-helix domain-containing protein [Streptomyces sp. NBC_01022]